MTDKNQELFVAEQNAVEQVRRFRGQLPFEVASDLMAELEFDSTIEVEYGFLQVKNLSDGRKLVLFGSAVGNSPAIII